MEKNHILRPYIKIQWRKKTNAGENIGNTPIKSITIGPGSNQQMTYQSVIHYIESEIENIPKIDKTERQRIIIGEELRTSQSNFKDVFVTEKGIIVRKSELPYIY